MIEHTISLPLPQTHLLGVEVPHDFFRALEKAAQKNGALVHDQLVAFAIAGAECARTHSPKPSNPRRRK